MPRPFKTIPYRNDIVIISNNNKGYIIKSERKYSVIIDNTPDVLDFSMGITDRGYLKTKNPFLFREHFAVKYNRSV